MLGVKMHGRARSWLSFSWYITLRPRVWRTWWLLQNSEWTFMCQSIQFNQVFLWLLLKEPNKSCISTAILLWIRTSSVYDSFTATQKTPFILKFSPQDFFSKFKFCPKPDMCQCSFPSYYQKNSTWFSPCWPIIFHLVLDILCKRNIILTFRKKEENVPFGKQSLSSGLHLYTCKK